MRAFVYSRVCVSVSLTDVIKRWPKESGQKNLKRHAASSLNPLVSCVSMLAHPIDEVTGGLVIKKIIEIMCIDPGYTIYKACDEGGEEWNLADTDTYDLAQEIISGVGSYKRVRVQPISFLNENDAHAVVSADLQKVIAGKKNKCDWYNNSHGIMDEFVLNTAMMPCSNCKNGFSGKRFTDKKLPLCKSCHPADRHKGINITTPKVIDLTKLSKLKENVFTKKHMVHEEYVTFMAVNSLPFVKGQDKLEAKYTNLFLEKCKSLVFDIETVTVDETLKVKIPDEIVIVSASLNTGTTMKKLVMLTGNIPQEWESSEGTINTELFLGDLRQSGQTALPNTRYISCPTEASLVESFKNLLLAYKPHLLVSYNGHGFDGKFLVRASVSNGLKEPFHGALNHFTSLVKINNTDPLSKVDPRDFLRPHGKHCRGLITDKVMTISYDSFPCLISIDLYPINGTSLNDACAAKKVNGCKLEGVAHTDIPRLYYGRHVDIFKYALVDVIITTDLYFKDRFDAFELYMELEELVSTPWNLSVSRQKTMTAQTTTHVQFHTNGFLRKGNLRPKRALTNAIVDDLADCIYDRSAKPKLDETVQIMVDFVNSHCKCNTLFRKLPKIAAGPLTENTLSTVLDVQIRQKKASDPPYSTVDAAMLLFYLFRGNIDWDPFEELTSRFASLVKDCPKKMMGLANFCLYLVRVRRCMSPLSETADRVWKEYRKNHKTDTVIASVLERFIKDNYESLIEAAKASEERPRPMAENMSLKKVTMAIKTACQSSGIKLKFLPYDGALIIFDKADINLKNPICVLDYRSMYPKIMIAINLGIDTNLSLEKVLECVEVLRKTRGLATRREAAAALAEEFVHVCFTREEDDRYDWFDFLDYSNYLSSNCQFFARNITSVQNHQFKTEIDSRVIDKLKAEDNLLPLDVRKKHLNRSTVKKVNINSRYGVIQSVINPKFQATVTGMGRRSIQRVTEKLKRLIGTKEMYGDTDSCFSYLPTMDVFAMVDMTPEEMYDEFQFGAFGVSLEQMMEMHAKYYPVDKTDPKAIRNAGGGIAQELYSAIAPALSTDAMEVDAEKKSLCPMFLPSKKKYTAYNCSTQKHLTKGLSMHNKSAIPMTKSILGAMVEIGSSCWNEHDLASSLYRYLGQEVTVPIELHLVDPKSIAKPCSINLRKIKPGSKQHTLVQSMVKDFIYEKIHVRTVAIYPEKHDKDWSLCDVLTQSCDGREHVVKIKFDVLKEVLSILRGKFCRGVCEPFEALMWGEFYPDKYTPDAFASLSVQKPDVYKPASFYRVKKRFIEGDWLDEDVSDVSGKGRTIAGAGAGAKKKRVSTAEPDPSQKLLGNFLGKKAIPRKGRKIDPGAGAKKKRVSTAEPDPSQKVMTDFFSTKNVPPARPLHLQGFGEKA